MVEFEVLCLKKIFDSLVPCSMLCTLIVFPRVSVTREIQLATVQALALIVYTYFVHQHGDGHAHKNRHPPHNCNVY